MSCCCVYLYWSVVYEYDYFYYVIMYVKSEIDVVYLEDCIRI